MLKQLASFTYENKKPEQIFICSIGKYQDVSGSREKEEIQQFNEIQFKIQITWRPEVIIDPHLLTEYPNSIGSEVLNICA